MSSGSGSVVRRGVTGGILSASPGVRLKCVFASAIYTQLARPGYYWGVVCGGNGSVTDLGLGRDAVTTESLNVLLIPPQTLHEQAKPLAQKISQTKTNTRSKSSSSLSF